MNEQTNAMSVRYTQHWKVGAGEERAYDEAYMYKIFKTIEPLYVV